MTCRRKLKGERELVADIRKRLRMYCNTQSCANCKYNSMNVTCEIAYVTDLLSKHGVELEEEEPKREWGNVFINTADEDDY